MRNDSEEWRLERAKHLLKRKRHVVNLDHIPPDVRKVAAIVAGIVIGIGVAVKVLIDLLQ